MSDLAIHPTTRERLDHLISDPPHAILVRGAAGSGLDTLGGWLATNLADKATTITHIYPEKEGITIEQVRSLYVATRNRGTRSIMVLHEADKMGEPAQNACLKLLEEPTEGTIFILLARPRGHLLPTIESRATAIDVLPITSQDSRALVSAANPSLAPAETAQILFIAGGLPAELTRLATDQAYRQRQFALARDAKAILNAKTAERLVLARSYAASRESAERLLLMIAYMLQFQVLRGAPPDTVKKLDRVNEALKNLSRYGNARLQLLGSLLPVQ